ncbi:MAG TPA: bifunctional diaminohydroxyphosphoribosylaminopyrimidine deaminase/5-amino-6-(5-phosphoribosylamino)uracil reductase RibD [Candidatus Kapabacteria bacterium]|nr:bifunctional diaminohydroxyphosphoribosylaminopyrimidine deaminase/5-amino-6-(5-phosphoribosylamino)uracil reductase RibD [Candidatus Kapabacteria bacterium]
MEDSSIGQREFDEAMMRRALEIARHGAGFVSPNPMVGAVITGADRTIIAEGWHERFGQAHAEINALRKAGDADLRGATMYVTLEPCNHHGKTPPCTEAIIGSGIGRVVVAMRDPNPLVGGKGNQRLRSHGIEVVLGVLEKEARRRNEAYIHYISTGSPFVIVKMAQTLDGFIALPNGESQWITGELARQRVHQLRAESDAVMVGFNTALKDNPSLTVRHGVGGRNPRRVVLDASLALPPTLTMLTDDERALTIVCTSHEAAATPRADELRAEGIDVLAVRERRAGELDLDEIVTMLGHRGIASLLVEGGATLAGAVVEGELARKVFLFIAPKLFGHGVTAFKGKPIEHVADAYRLNIHAVRMVGEDVMVVAYWHGT